MRRLLPATATIAGVAVALRVIFDGWYLNYDARYALLWARDVAHGFKPEYEAAFAPTPHPLSTAWSALALPFGQSGDQLMVWFVLLSFGALVYLAYRLGAELFSPAVGVVTALVVLTRPALERDALLGYQDVPFAVLIVLAALLEARRPRRGAAVLAVLFVAGLLRPEAWVLAGLYWLYLFGGLEGRDRIRLALLVAAAPALWALTDLIVTGDALHSLHGTSDLAEANDRRRSLGDVPKSVVQYLGFALREPGVLAVPLGLAFAWRHRERYGRAAAIPVAIVAAMTVVFALNPIFGLPLIARYVRASAVLLMLFYGLAVCGWLLLGREHPERRLWTAVAAVAVVASLVYLPWHVGLLGDLRDKTSLEGNRYRSLRALTRIEPVRKAFAACGPLATTDHRPEPYLRWWLDGDPGSVVTLEGGSARPGRLVVVPRPTRLQRRWLR
ncbi:MAG: hypothetical protein QOI80_1778, partial [Solirubrobacteraceae bacterium]|nr:hypothetical protein [Solirubrobacteraceae bacterium]